MRETVQDLRDLQQLLDDGYAKAGEHLRSIFRSERRMSAEEIVDELRGVFVLNLATVTKAGEPFLAPLDGLFYRSHFWFGIPPGGLRIRHLRARPSVSANYVQGEDVCIIVHGQAREVASDEPLCATYLEYARETYGPAVWDYWNAAYEDRAGTGFTAWIEPKRMFARKAASQRRGPDDLSGDGA